MTFELTKDEIAQRAVHNQRLDTARAEVLRKIKRFNAAVDEARLELESAVGDFETAVTNANSWRAIVHQRLELGFARKTLRWMNSITGKAAAKFVNAWDEEFEPDFDIVVPEPIDPPDLPDDGEWFADYPEVVEK